MAGYADKFMITALRVGREEEIEEKRQKGGMRNRIQARLVADLPPSNFMAEK